MKTRVSLGDKSYDILMERGLLGRAGDYLNLDRKVLIVTDSGVPEVYAETLAKQCKTPCVQTVPMGEGSKSLEVFGDLLGVMLKEGFTRKDCVVAVGGGVCGDLAGFVAASYMRGVDFYNIPTTVLSQVDSSIGGKTAVNLNGIKNIVGAFYQPKCVLIDSDVLHTLSPRQISEGLAEALKMSMTFDLAMFEKFEAMAPLQVLKPAGTGDQNLNLNPDRKGCSSSICRDFPEEELAQLEELIFNSIEIKRRVVEEDEKEQGLRRVLNFGHTIGHGLEAEEAIHGLFHGECVALGMIPMCSEEARARLIPILEKLNLPVNLHFTPEVAMEAMLHDKKGEADHIKVVRVEKPGSFVVENMSYDTLNSLLPLVQAL